MFLPQAVIQGIEALIQKSTGKADSIQNIRPVGGGDINRALRLEGKSGSYFAKMNQAGVYPDMFQVEAAGLRALGSAAPAVIGFGSAGSEAFLVLEWIEPTQNAITGQENLGRVLASIHQESADQFGLSYDNYIGTIRQQNTPCDAWADFFIQNRLQYLLQIADGKGLVSVETQRDFERIFRILPTLFEAERPSLLHGDLWSGNYLITHQARPILIDPAVYYGHREMDIAMTTLFGGFEPPFYEAYHEQFPLAAGWQERTALWNLYPLLVHVILFGRTYLPQLLTYIKKWT